MGPTRAVEMIAALSFENAFNPYSQTCPVHDLAEAPALRRAALQSILASASAQGVEALWIGRDLGHRGGRRTGLAFTDDLHLEDHARRWNLTVARATKGPAVGERTATIVWSLLAEIQAPIFLWNAFPLHPHAPGAPFTNRAHTAAERGAGEEVLHLLVAMLRPRRIIAIGRDAASAAGRVSGRAPMLTARHPSFGGHNAFVSAMRALYGH
jgi:hypothetical protein